MANKNNSSGNNSRQNSSTTSSPKQSPTESLKSIDSDKNEVRVYKPKVILLSFHGTISPLDWEDECLVPYVKTHLESYINKHWEDSELIKLVSKLRYQSQTHYYEYQDESVPLIPEEDDSDDNIDDQLMKKSVAKFVKWQIDSGKESNDSFALQKFVWLKGYREKSIKTKVFDDVLQAFKQFKNLGIHIVIHSSMSTDVSKLCLSSTTHGDLTPYFHTFLDKSVGQRQSQDTYKNIAAKLSVNANDILYVTGSGSDAKDANECGIKCLLITRPGNRRIREYYRLKFSVIQTLLEITFVNKPK